MGCVSTNMDHQFDKMDHAKNQLQELSADYPESRKNEKISVKQKIEAIGF